MINGGALTQVNFTTNVRIMYRSLRYQTGTRGFVLVSGLSLATFSVKNRGLGTLTVPEKYVCTQIESLHQKAPEKSRSLKRKTSKRDDQRWCLDSS